MVWHFRQKTKYRLFFERIFNGKIAAFSRICENDSFTFADWPFWSIGNKQQAMCNAFCQLQIVNCKLKPWLYRTS
jgi:hypothetical protein